MATVEGIVEYKGANKFGGYSIKVNGNFYNSKFEPKCEKGDYVEFDDGGKKYINALKKKTSPPVAGVSAPGNASANKRYRNNGEEGGFPVHPLAYERALDRRNALQCATRLFGEHGIDSEDLMSLAKDIIDVARYFEAYTTGDLERVEAEKLFNSVSGDD